ncbi:hypothetical protein [Mesorhizobium sp. B2-4-6]|uniref:hypothetical protein n=1 Tax=Mesorhizobium sp. B2-4-6 TaxID=2589943 RepID=UPI00112C0B79|nr:hypothetical protein [Mesorhizobium sp. B2-4-6]TPL40694.1 hypothetical protein FJ957_26040 [Mesorhizobium sp. B2-4-6]
MPDYAGAKAAIRERFEDGWADRTRIAFINEDPEQPWPPKRDSGGPAPWTLIEIKGSGSGIWTFGTDGNRGWRYDGVILAHIYTPVGEGTDEADELAVAAGEIYRAAKFYDDVEGYYVRTLAPEVLDGEDGDEDGKWFVTTMTVEFTYWHRG